MSSLPPAIARVAIDRDVLVLRGPDALPYLQGQCSQDLEPLEPGEARYAFLLQPTGKVVSLIRVVLLGPEEVLVDTDGGGGPAVEERLRRFKLRSRFDIVDPHWRAVGLRGPASRPDGQATSRADGDGVSVAWAWGILLGQDYLGPDPDGWLQQVFGTHLPPPCSPEEWDAMRILAGIPVATRDFDQDTVPAETGLLDVAVSFTKGCYTGQELVARMDARGNHAVRYLRGLRFSGGTAEVLVGAALLDTSRDRQVGTVSSAAPAAAAVGTGHLDGGGAMVGLALVHRSVEPGGSVAVGETGVTAEVLELPAP